MDKKISLISAMTKDHVIGDSNKNKMPWYIPEELKYFKKITLGKSMIMGRKTFDSIGRRLLPGRKSIILTRDNIDHNSCVIADSVDSALNAAMDNNYDSKIDSEIMIIGGAGVYKQFMPLANKMYISIIHKDYSGDIFFPEYNKSQWQIIEENKYVEFTAQVLEKI